MSRTYTLKDIAKLTNYSVEELQTVVDKGELALTQTSDRGEQRVTELELKRWWQSAEGVPEWPFDKTREGEQ